MTTTDLAAPPIVGVAMMDATEARESLAERARTLCPQWQLRLTDDGAIELRGNGPLAIWRSAASCADWLTHQEGGKTR